MKLLIYYIFLTLICGIYASHQVDNNKSYKIRKGIRAVLNAPETKTARSSEECAVQCASTNGCKRANFRGNSTCELQNYESQPGTEIELLPQNDSTYLYSTSCDHDPCLNGRRCQSAATGITCRCPHGYAGSTCSEECDLIHDGRCYAFVAERVTWYEARDFCNQKGGRLVEVCEAGLNDALLETIGIRAPGASFWLGGTDELVEGQWRWLTGSCDWLFDDWGVYHDGDRGRNCLSINARDHWKDINCGQLRRIICEFY